MVGRKRVVLSAGDSSCHHRQTARRVNSWRDTFVTPLNRDIEIIISKAYVIKVIHLEGLLF